MASYQLTRKADHDLAAYYEYGIVNFGLSQARSYLLGLHECFEGLAASPELGRSAEELFPGLRRIEHKAHVVFYLVNDTPTILVVRVLRKEMDFKQHLNMPLL